MMIQTKRIDHTTYIKCGAILGEIKGPYVPGSVWKSEVYHTTPAFEAAWIRGTLTPVQLGRVSQEADQLIAAMTFGQTGALDPSFYTVTECLGYRYKGKKLAVQAVHDYFTSHT